ncbi:uncharacterized protein PHACADRAFT_214873 [Phanerochaete carnosa HHB-10118-sp]|uniref:Uncharacterized protein n=1 Tax=Phanerochaete carnosa (strain HHB-10118-sp) TaxID=650164 RepID=K5VB20_PHACS|nr:uncharacterized protein PHACADRAFT_214873 [Phanerochaete carnosa HHB-10118-sp]EKM48273.1 hypothetical protein PHACADRAFT_214873 [Phanerochaete carnosa HHB-10118-sp]
MDAPGDDGHTADLTWENVGLAFSFIAFNAVVSRVFQLGVGTSLVTAAVRCVVQLTLVSLVLQKVFEAKNPWAVAGIAFLLNLMGTIETVANKAKRRFQHMFPSVLFGMLCSTIPISMIGIRYAMAVDPFWKPEQYIPVVGMLCGATISGIVVACNYVLKELYENKDKIETYLAFGASRFEACKPIATDALRLALTPNVNQMSVLGIIAIPGMMTGAILGGSSVQQAARLQMVIMFMISSCTALSSIMTTVLALSVVVDAEHRVRTDKIDNRPHAVWRARNWLVSRGAEGLKSMWNKVAAPIRKRTKSRDEGEESERLLG